VHPVERLQGRSIGSSIVSVLDGNWKTTQRVRYPEYAFLAAMRATRRASRAPIEEQETSMKRMAIRAVVLLGGGLVVVGAASACASEDSSTTFRQDAGGTCASFCQHPPNAVACCLQGNVCGINYGPGCVPWKKDAG